MSHELNIIQLSHSKLGLNLTLTPVQTIVLKLIYGLDLDDQTPFEVQTTFWGTTETMTETEYIHHLIEEDRYRSRAGHGGASVVMGRRSGKSLLTHLILIYEAYIRLVEEEDHEARLFSIYPSKDMAMIQHPILQSLLERCGYLASHINTKTRLNTYLQDGEADLRISGGSLNAFSHEDPPNVQLAVLDEIYAADQDYEIVTGKVDRALVFSSPGEGGEPPYHSEAGLALQIPSWEVAHRADRMSYETNYQKLDTQIFQREWGASF